MLLDLSLPERLLQLLTLAGHDVTHAKHLGLHGEPPEKVQVYAASDQRLFVTDEPSAADLRRFPLDVFPATLVVRMPRDSLTFEMAMASRIGDALVESGMDENFRGLVIVDPRRVRVRRAAAAS